MSSKVYYERNPFEVDCERLMQEANGEPVPPGMTWKDEGTEYRAFASQGYRNCDVVNSLIAFAVVRPELPCFTQKECDKFLDEYKDWLQDHVAEEDYGAAALKAEVVVNYIDRYRKEPERYVIDAPYWHPEEWN